LEIESQPPLRIDLGCGNAKRDGFVGLDQFPGPQVDHVLDLTTDRYPFEDRSVTEVFSAHFLEHIDSPNHVFGEIGRICRDRARIEFWTPYAFTNDAFLYGHLHAITEEMWLHLGCSHRDVYAPMLNGRWQLQSFIYVIEQATIDDLAANGIDLDFAVRYFKGVVHELGVEIEFREDLSVAVSVPARRYATSRAAERRVLVPGGSRRASTRMFAARGNAFARRIGRGVRRITGSR
jgi:SAM-dependent methyltransferase